MKIKYSPYPQLLKRLPDPPKSDNRENLVRTLGDAFIEIGREASREAIVGAAMAGLVVVGQSLGSRELGIVAALDLGDWRGLVTYGGPAEAALQNKGLGKMLAATLGMSTAALCSVNGNLIQGVAVGALLGVVQAARKNSPQ